MTTTPTDLTDGRDPEYDAETEMMEAAVGALEGALALIDQRPALTAGEQLATLAVAGIRAVVPILRDELERRQA